MTGGGDLERFGRSELKSVNFGVPVAAQHVFNIKQEGI